MTQPWYPQALELSCMIPLLLPKQNRILTLPHDQERLHPLERTLQLVVWTVCENNLKIRDFRKGLQNCYVNRGIQRQISNISQHGSLWLGWCSGQLPDPFSPSVGDIGEFLSDEFHKGKSYSSINTLRSSLSSILNTIDGFAVRKHPTVILKGVYNSKPPVPKYCITWDVSIVLSYIKTLPCNEDLTLKELSHKLAILIALVSADKLFLYWI